MKESLLNTIISNNFKRIGFACKIPDPMQGVGIQRPFDGFAVFGGDSLYWEAKLIKRYQAFSFKKIEEHQLKNLLLIKKENKIAICVIILGVFAPYKYFDLFFFDINYINGLINEGKKSLFKKELLSLKERNLCLPIKKENFDTIKSLRKVIKIKEY